MELTTQQETTTTFRGLYDQLNDGQKRTLLCKYNFLFGSKKTFFRKINGETILRKAEEIFFINNLNKQQNEKER